MSNWPTNPPRMGLDIGYIYTDNGKTWIWNGYAWDSSSAIPVQPYSSIIFRHSSISPIDNQLYFFGDFNDQLPLTTLSDASKVLSLFDGEITGYSILLYPEMVTGSSELSNYLLYNETKGLNVFETNIPTDTVEALSINLDTPVSISRGDKLYIKWTTPTWSTNPTNLRSRIEIKIKLTNV